MDNELRALVDQMRDMAQRGEHAHILTLAQWADELDRMLSALLAQAGQHEKDQKDLARMDTMGEGDTSRTASQDVAGSQRSMSLSTTDRIAMRGIAKAEAQHQMTRPFSHYYIGGLNDMQRGVVSAMLFSAVTGAIEAWEGGRESRERETFYGR